MKIIILTVACFLSLASSAQFTPYGVGTLGRTITTVQAVGIGNFPTVADLRARLHVSNFYCSLPGSATLNGRLFRTDGNSAVNNTWDLWTGANATSLTQKFRITQLSGVTQNNTQLGTVQNGTLSFLTSNLPRVTILPTGISPTLTNYNNSGYVGLNNPNPQFHLDINTQEPDGNTTYGELLFRARINDDPNAYISFLNFATTGGVFLPALMGRQSAATSSTAINVAGVLDNAQDLPTNIPAVEFIAGRNYDPSNNLWGIQALVNRPLFEWNNGPNPQMTMISNGFVGVLTQTPGNRFEINNAAGTSHTTANGGSGGATGFSGLRFTDLRSTSVPYATNPGLGVLALDANGDVIYVAQGTAGPGGGVNNADNGVSISNNFIQLGKNAALCGDNTAQLTTNREIPMNGRFFHFSNAGGTNGLTDSRVGIGVDGCESINGKLEIKVKSTDNASTALLINQELNGKGMVLNVNAAGTVGAGNNFGQQINVTASNPTAQNFGTEIMANGGSINYGINSQANNGTNTNVGVRGFGVVPTTSMSHNNGVEGVASGSGKINVGVFGFSRFDTNNANANIGVFGSTARDLTNIGIVGEFAGLFDGDVRVIGTTDINGALFVNGVQVLSDKRYKEDIVKLENTSDKIKQISGYSYNMRAEEFKEMNFSENAQIGLLAQEIKEVFPELVVENEAGYMTVNYDGMVPVLLEVAKEQQTQLEAQASEMAKKEAEISDLNERLAKLENCLSALLPTLCSMNQEAIQTNSEEEQARIKDELKNTIEVRLSNKNAIILAQNVPNPFAESTVIAYTIPASVKVAQIHFYTANGEIINSVDIVERGNGELRVFAQDLSTGIYTYTLVADGNIVATKKMMKQ